MDYMVDPIGTEQTELSMRLSELNPPSDSRTRQFSPQFISTAALMLDTNDMR